MPSDRCPLCYARLGGESQLAHELSGRCTARERTPYVPKERPCPRSWGAGTKKGFVRNDVEPPPHGTRSRYTSKKWKCHCDDCRAADTAYAAERREARRGAA